MKDKTFSYNIFTSEYNQLFHLVAQYSVFYTTLQPYSCPSPGEYVYSSPSLPLFCEAEIQLLECVACNTSRLRRRILPERSAGHATPRRRFSLLVHELPLSDHWPRRHVWFIDSKGRKQVGLGLDLFRGYDYNGNLEEGKGIDRDDEFPSLCSSSGHVSIISGSRKAQRLTSDSYIHTREFLCMVLWLRNRMLFFLSK